MVTKKEIMTIIVVVYEAKCLKKFLKWIRIGMVATAKLRKLSVVLKLLIPSQIEGVI